MRIVYSDETGTGDVRREPLVVVAAVVIDPSYESRLPDDPAASTTQWTRMHTRLGFLIEEAAEQGLLVDGEIKGSVLMNRVRKRTADRINAWNLLANVATVAFIEHAKIFYGAVDRAGLAAWHQAGNVDERSEFARAFGQCLGAVEDHASLSAPPEHLVWIHDFPGAHERALMDELNRLNRFFLTDTIAELGLPHSRVLNPVTFGRSEESRMLQLADVCCTIIAEHLRSGPHANLYNAIRAIVGNDGWRPQLEPTPQME